MTSLRRAWHDHRSSGAFNTLLPVWAFLDGSTFLTKGGSVGCVFSIAGIDYEGCDHEGRERIVHRFQAALKPLDERFHVYEYLLKRRIPPFTVGPCAHPVAADALQRRVDTLNARRETLYAFDLFVVILAHGPKPRTITTSSQKHEITFQQTELDALVKRLHHAAGAFEVSLADVLHPRRLPKQEAFAFLERLVNFDPQTLGMPLTSDTHVDYFLPNSAVSYDPDRITVGTHTAKVLTMKAAPSQTFAQLLHDLDCIPGEFLACLDWQRVPDGTLRTDLFWRSKYYQAKALTNTSAAESLKQVGEVQLDMEHNSRSFGQCSLTVLVHGRDPHAVDEAAAFAIKVLAAHDGIFLEETRNGPNAWLAMLPGNMAYNVRAPHLILSDVNLADLSFLFTLDRGQERSAHLKAPALAVFETATETPYFHNIHVEDVGHTLILGATGSGKSFGLNMLLMHAQQYDPFTVVFDLGHSYRKLAHALNGSYLELGSPRPTVQLNPFALPLTDANVQFLCHFVQVLLEGKGGEALTDREQREVYEQVLSLRAYDPPERRLWSLSLPSALQKRLNPWLEGGRFPLFDHETDTLALQRFQVFEFEAMARYPELLEPLLFYVLHRVSAQIGTGFSIVVLDEAWRFVRHLVLRDYIRESLKTWRKKNAAVWLATQTLKDFESSDLLRTVIESCPTKLLLANPSGFDRAEYADKLQLNEMELDHVAALIPKQQLFLKRPDVSKVLTLRVDPKAAWLYSNDTAMETV